jgi:hypothetical protein
LSRSANSVRQAVQSCPGCFPSLATLPGAPC